MIDFTNHICYFVHLTCKYIGVAMERVLRGFNHFRNVSIYSLHDILSVPDLNIFRPSKYADTEQPNLSNDLKGNS